MKHSPLAASAKCPVGRSGGYVAPNASLLPDSIVSPPRAHSFKRLPLSSPIKTAIADRRRPRQHRLFSVFDICKYIEKIKNASEMFRSDTFPDIYFSSNRYTAPRFGQNVTQKFSSAFYARFTAVRGAACRYERKKPQMSRAVVKTPPIRRKTRSATKKRHCTAKKSQPHRIKNNTRLKGRGSLPE